MPLSKILPIVYSAKVGKVPVLPCLVLIAFLFPYVAGVAVLLAIIVSNIRLSTELNDAKDQLNKPKITDVKGATFEQPKANEQTDYF